MASPYGGLRKEVEAAAEELLKDETHYVPTREAEELFRLPNDAVQIFFVSPDGKVSTFSEPSSLRIFRFNQEASDEDWTPVFIQVGGWTHPLIPGASPVLEAVNGALMFPDVYADSSSTEAAVGLVLSDEVPAEVRAQLLAILEEHTALRKVADPSTIDEHNLGAIGRTLLKSAELVSKGLEKGAQKATELIEYVGEKQKAKLEPVDAEGRPQKVNPALKVTAKGALYATHATVKVSGFVAKRVGKLTKGVANYLANKATPAVVGSDGSGVPKSSSLQKLVDAARGGLLAYGTVYSSLENSAKVIGTSMKDQTVQVVNLKYGNETAEVLGDSMTAAGNAAMTYMNVQSLGVKGLVKRTAKETGKSLGKNILDATAKSSSQEQPKVPKMDS